MAQRGLAWLRHGADTALALLFPSTCVGCGRLGEHFCATCAQAVEATPHPQCARCGVPQATFTQRCRACRQVGDAWPWLTRAAALHTSPLREAIHSFKYGAQPQLGRELARYLVAVYAEPPWSTLPQPISAVVPVPLHAQRLAERGYNQAELLAANFCGAVGLPLQATWLARMRDTPHQVGLASRQRQANVQGAFLATGDVAGQSILLIDDVYTTGSTLRACARAALDAGANSVFGLTLAMPVSSP